MQDQVTLVNEHDEVIGSMDKVEAHRGEGKLHRAISVFLFRKNENSGEIELLIQQRSTKKIVGAGQWANTVCGNVWPGESYEECAHRRLHKELGIMVADQNEKINLLPIDTFQYQVKCNEEFSENEIDQVFVGWFDGNVALNPEEVSEYEWKSWKEVSYFDGSEKFRKNWAPWFKLLIKNKKLSEQVEKL